MITIIDNLIIDIKRKQIECLKEAYVNIESGSIEKAGELICAVAAGLELEAKAIDEKNKRNVADILGIR